MRWTDCEIDLGCQVCDLPNETRIEISLFGSYQDEQKLLAWTHFQLINANGLLNLNLLHLPLWTNIEGASLVSLTELYGSPSANFLKDAPELTLR